MKENDPTNVWLGGQPPVQAHYPIDRLLSGMFWCVVLLAILCTPAAVALTLADHKAERRADELWKEFDTHVRYCPCLHREWPVEEEGDRK